MLILTLFLSYQIVFSMRLVFEYLKKVEARLMEHTPLLNSKALQRSVCSMQYNAQLSNEL